MKQTIEEIFLDKGVYKLKQIKDDNVFVCQALPGNQIGKLVMYNKRKEGLYERTSTQYFLNSYYPGDLKELFICRTNYDMVGKVGVNYLISEDKQYILR